MAPLVPLQTLVCESVPLAKLGEANGLIGSAKSISALSAYALTMAVSQVMISSERTDLQWIFFPGAAVLSLGMLPFACSLRRANPTAADEKVDASKCGEERSSETSIS